MRTALHARFSERRENLQLLGAYDDGVCTHECHVTAVGGPGHIPVGRWHVSHRGERRLGVRGVLGGGGDDVRHSQPLGTVEQYDPFVALAQQMTQIRGKNEVAVGVGGGDDLGCA